MTSCCTLLLYSRSEALTQARERASDLRGAEGNRTPDLLDANETRYQLRYSPGLVPREHSNQLTRAARGPLLADGPAVGQRTGSFQLVELGVAVVEVDHGGTGRQFLRR